MGIIDPYYLLLLSRSLHLQFVIVHNGRAVKWSLRGLLTPCLLFLVWFVCVLRAFVLFEGLRLLLMAGYIKEGQFLLFPSCDRRSHCNSKTFVI